MFRNAAKFVRDFSDIASKFDWYYFKRQYKVNENLVVINEIRGAKPEGTKEYTPLTALAEYLTGKYFEIDRFEVAADAIEMTPECAMQVTDASDEWPDRLHGYVPKNYERKIRDDLIQACFKQKEV